MTEQLFQSKLKLKDKEDNLEKGNRSRGRDGNHGRSDFKDRGRGSYGQRKFDESNSNSNSSRGRGRQHYSRSSGERSNNDRRVEKNANYAEKDEESGDSSLFLACKGAKICENSAWYLDSGVSNHMCGMKSMFVELDGSVGGDIVFGDTTKIPVKGKARKNMVKGLPYVKHPDQLCEGCLHGKQSRKSFPQESSSRARRPLDRKTWVYFVKKKSEVFGMFKRFKALVEKESGYYIKALRLDRGGEFTSNEFKTFCVENGIRGPMTILFTPQQNCVVERKNRTILNMTRSMLKCKKMPKEFWAQAVECAVEPLNFEEALQNDKWKIAMDEEIKAIKKNDTWELSTLPNEKKAVGVKWVFKIKRNEKGEVERYKARLVAKGYSQRKGIDYIEVFAPVARLKTIRLLIALAAQNNWKIFQMDVKSAFLNGYLEEEVYLEQPPGYSVKGQENKVLKLKKALYGLKQAPRMWNSRINKYFLDNGYLTCPYEHSLYIKVNGHGDILVVCLYVDDLIFTGNCASMFEDLKNTMTQEFEMTDIGLMSYYLGIEVKQSEEGIFIS
ncbi:reverse transcriptase [Cucumis melo var. makuwa]|uniref:Reverse transcriptase n=1 Tax=Cucumis melo var. makuwa TaxID=1194695 RepID=A0A5A7TPN3_CUCMM|nr:reverse transcriptase [Cucumis melo var. makuwa]